MRTIQSFRFVGIDLGARKCQVCITDQDGQVLINTSVISNMAAIAALLKRFDALPAPVAVEATFSWYWLADGLKDLGCDVHLVHAAKCSAITTAKVKTDRRDAEILAQLLRSNMLPEAYLYPREGRGFRDLVRQRHSVVESVSGLLRKLRGILYREGHSDHTLDDAKDLEREDLPDLFKDPMVQFQAEAIIAEIKQLTVIRKSIEDKLLASVEEQQEHRLLQTIPGIGKILALVIYSEIGDIHRFKSPQGFSSYCRVAPGIAQSGESKRHGRANKAGNPHLKRSLHQAAVSACTHDPLWKRWRQKLMARHSGAGSIMKATNSVAHRIARIIYYILNHHVPYEAEHARLV